MLPADQLCQAQAIRVLGGTELDEDHASGRLGQGKPPFQIVDRVTVFPLYDKCEKEKYKGNEASATNVHARKR